MSTVETDDLRILLWDIDGTLMRSARPDWFKEYTVPLLENVFGTAGRLPEMTVSGMTDLQIVIEALRDEGFTREEIRGRIRKLKDSYVTVLEQITTGQGAEMFEVLPGVREALAAADAHPRYRSALLTGNVQPAARLKVSLAGLSEYFTLPGAFGDDSHDRRNLPRFAQKRINRKLELKLKPSQFIVIGDTPNDIACARYFGARSVVVATGRTYKAEELLQLQPDALLKDLSDTELLMRTLSDL